MGTVDLVLPSLHDAQLLVLDEHERFGVLECGRRFGKTLLGVDQIIRHAVDGLPCAWFAPTYKMLAEVMRECRRILAPLIEAGLVRENRSEKRWEFATGGAIDFWSLNDADTPRGRFYAFVVVDEADYVRELAEVWTRVIRPMLTDLRGSALLMSTPKGVGDFHRLYLRGQQRIDGWRSWRMPTTSNPFIDPAEVEAARLELPEHAFRQEYLGEPAEGAANPFGVDAIDDCCVLDSPTCGAVGTWGVDLAKSVDWTVAIGLSRPDHARVMDCTHMQRWQGDWRQTVARLRGMLKAPSLVDSTGVGDPIVEELRRTNAHVEGFKFTTTSRQALLEGLAAAIHQRRLRIPRSVLRDELLAFRYEFGARGARYAAPPGVHDDTVMALALAVQCSATSLGSLELDIGDAGDDFFDEDDFNP